MKGVWTLVKLYILHDDSYANGNEVTVIIVGEGWVVHLSLQSAGGIACTAAERDSPNFS